MIFLLTFSMVIRFFSDIKQFKNLPSTTNFYWFTEIRDTLAGSFLPVKYDSEENPLYFNAIFLKNNLRKSRRHLYADEKRKILELNAAKKSLAENNFSSLVTHGNSESTLKLGLPLVFRKMIQNGWNSASFVVYQCSWLISKLLFLANNHPGKPLSVVFCPFQFHISKEPYLVSPKKRW